VAHGPAAVASPRPSAAGTDRSPAKAWRKRCGPARAAHRAACSGVWHDTWADGSFEASSVVTGHLRAAYAVDVISAVVVAQVAARAMKAAGFGTMIVTGGAFADHPIPALATVSLGKAALRSAATMLGPTWSLTAYGWLRSRSPDGSLPVPPLTRSVLLSATGTLSKLTASGRRSFALPASSEVTRMRAEHEIAGDASNHPSGRLGDS
jgi:hypothetical protein